LAHEAVEFERLEFKLFQLLEKPPFFSIADEFGLIAETRGKARDPVKQVGASLRCAIPTIPISRSSGSRSVIPIDPDQTGVSAPLDAFADLRVCGSGQA
ncbi:MAG TPA: hypothetical protein VK955_13075, partial [Xanthobacteraceae bacterium]|nr:hypothetical protein [Xanthobacteraceae bacterium]